MTMLHYFAYGSNMSARRIRHRLGWSPSRIAVTLQDYLLAFNKQSADGGKANIKVSSGDEVEGILYFVKEDDLLTMDTYEGVAEQQYKRLDIEVIDLSGRKMPAVAYVALNTGPESRPTVEYLNYLLEGEHLLSQEYASRLEDIATL
ncbi:MAG: gamma-glutamylcyclotransferase [Candidatus Marinimicrobia bacterium]|nr:gamma-glutamylcyclotransferase [Candidatus Neomarinimicrobiota bacterium]MBT6638159.1 gamma-glutamylcyclotransferase [Candidatus Neomarinimicrobiota bacterium]